MSTVVFSGCNELISEGYEDFTTYEHIYDQNSYISVSGENTIVVNNIPVNSYACLRKAISIPGDFSLKFTIVITELTMPIAPDINGGWFGIAFAQSSDVHGLYGADFGQGYPLNQTFGIYFRAFSGTNLTGDLTVFRDMSRSWAEGYLARSDWNDAILNEEYQMEVIRTNTDVYSSVYKDGMLIWSDSYTGMEQSYNYFFPFIGRGNGNPMYIASCILKDYELAIG